MVKQITVLIFKIHLFVSHRRFIKNHFFPCIGGGVMKYRNMGEQQWRNLRSQAAVEAISQEHQLPQEWTY